MLGSRWIRHPCIWEAEGLQGGGDLRGVRSDGDERGRSRKAAGRLWQGEVARIEACLGAAAPRSGTARKISSFLEFLASEPMQSVRRIWSDWFTSRLRHRSDCFRDPMAVAEIHALYSDGRRVDVVLGGPPCQGFSRVGRGKMRSLHEQGANVHVHEGAGDERNLLFLKYVQFVSALAPRVFLFENVATFRSAVRTADGSFEAAAALEQAFDDVSGKVHYEVDMRTLQCADHGVPQNRARFFMAGVSRTSGDDRLAAALAGEILSLERSETAVPLRAVLDDLPEVVWSQGRASDLAQRLRRRLGGRMTRPPVMDFVLQPVHGTRRDPTVDGHVARRPRTDDARWFALMAPGARWMDYRCDSAPLLQELRGALDLLAALVTAAGSPGPLGTGAHHDLDDARMGALESAIDAKLAIRLISQAQGELRRAPGRGLRDYGCGRAPTLARLRDAIAHLRRICKASSRGVLGKATLRELVADLDRDAMRDLAAATDGSLSIRLLLEQISAPGKDAGHHLLRTVYLSKKSGHHGDWLKRLDPDQPCRTIVSHMAKDTYPFVHPFEPRMLSVREAARIQTFPDAFSFSAVGLFHAFKMIGNAVPPLLSHQLAGAVAMALPLIERQADTRLCQHGAVRTGFLTCCLSRP